MVQATGGMQKNSFYKMRNMRKRWKYFATLILVMNKALTYMYTYQKKCVDRTINDVKLND